MLHSLQRVGNAERATAHAAARVGGLERDQELIGAFGESVEELLGESDINLIDLHLTALYTGSIIRLLTLDADTLGGEFCHDRIGENVLTSGHACEITAEVHGDRSETVITAEIHLRVGERAVGRNNLAGDIETDTTRRGSRKNLYVVLDHRYVGDRDAYQSTTLGDGTLIGSYSHAILMGALHIGDRTLLDISRAIGGLSLDLIENVGLRGIGHHEIALVDTDIVGGEEKFAT